MTENYAIREIDRLYQLDYADRVELVVRFGSITTTAILHWIYTDQLIAFVWLVGFFTAHTLCFFHLKRARIEPARYALPLAAVLNSSVHASFLWFPLTLIYTDDALLTVAGAAAVVAAFFFVLRRSDTLILVVWCQGIVNVTSIAVVAFGTIDRIDGLFPKLCAVFCFIMVAVYFVIALAKSSNLRIEAETAAAQAAQEQKLASIGRLAGGVAHDFNNALTGISGNMELYFELDDPKERDELIRIAQDAAHRAAELVNQLLVFSRKSGISRRRFPVAVLIEEATKFEQRLLPVNITLRSVSEPGLLVDVDKSLFVTALINLSVNAVDAMPEGGTLTILAERRNPTEPTACVDGRSLPPGRYAVISVSDTGTGIPPEILPRIVEPFFSTKPVGKGSGLGLSMVIGLAQSLDGGVQIETGPRGTKVSIYVPDQAPVRPVVARTDTAA